MCSSCYELKVKNVDIKAVCSSKAPVYEVFQYFRQIDSDVQKQPINFENINSGQCKEITCNFIFPLNIQLTSTQKELQKKILKILVTQ